MPSLRDARRFMDRLGSVGGGACWEWTGSITPNGYGTFWTGSKGDGSGRTSSAHRFSYELFVGEIGPGLHLDHVCRNRACVNPNHLEPVSPRENLMRGETLAAANVAKTRCRNGHEYSAENTYRYPDGSRSCRTCMRATKKRGRERRRERAA